MLKDVGQDIDGERNIVCQHPCEIRRLLARGIRIQVPADGLDFLCDPPRRAAPGSLERHVLEQMGNAVPVGRFVTRARIDPHPDRRRLDSRHGIRGNTQAGRQPRNRYRHDRLP
jgi:hypothetical protein